MPDPNAPRPARPAAGSARLALAGAVVALVAGCADLSGLAPQAKLTGADQLASSATFGKAAIEAKSWPAPDWWKAFGDPGLDRLIDEALASSPTLDVAAARSRKALALAQIARAGLLPQTALAAGITRQRYSGNALMPPPIGGSWDTDYLVQANLSWEIDFWGKQKSAFEAALGAARAAAIDADAARLVLAVDIADTYVGLQRAYARRDIAQQTLSRREQVLALTRDRNAAGIDSRLEVKQAEAALPVAREEIAQLDESIALARDQLAALLGKGPDRGLAIVRPAAHALGPLMLPSAIPAELLGRRPDLVAQRLRIEAAGKDIDVAKASFYPNVNLVAMAGLESFGISHLVSSGSETFGVGPAVTLPIFDQGRLRGNLAARDADYDAAVSQYNQMVADALREVADRIVSWKSIETQRKEQAQAVATAQEAYDLALIRYREGIGNYLQVLSAEQPLLVQQGLDVDLRARELTVSINLIRALGGGFSEGHAS
ncbi:MAG: efflux transporter outer membrane subunit [Proteobacteria bacterium]|jgi:NodT family efflux transporter outer membrane factor (OMF) lipoprotein|nr:efflux transporter outer membrane subunit [Pseudomonadota bacterium]